jgi:hypothetical protein
MQGCRCFFQDTLNYVSVVAQRSNHSTFDGSRDAYDAIRTTFEKVVHVLKDQELKKPGREQGRLNRLEQAIGERFSYWEFTTRRVLLLGLFAEMAAIMVQPSSVCVRPSTAPRAL